MKRLLTTACLMIWGLIMYGGNVIDSDYGHGTNIPVEPAEIIDDELLQHGGMRTVMPVVEAKVANGNLSVAVSKYVGFVTVCVYSNAGSLLSTFTGYANGKIVVSGNIDYDPNESYTIRIQLDGGSYVGHF